jgi:hypothetical protein
MQMQSMAVAGVPSGPAASTSVTRLAAQNTPETTIRN